MTSDHCPFKNISIGSLDNIMWWQIQALDYPLRILNMLITNRKNTKFGKYDGFSTNLLIGEINSGSKEISIQITDVEPDGMQFLHSHRQEQCYYIISGTGLIIIDDQTNEVKEGDAVFIPSNSTHGIKNIGNNMLTYLTANQSFGKQRENELWPEERAV